MVQEGYFNFQRNLTKIRVIFNLSNHALLPYWKFSQKIKHYWKIIKDFIGLLNNLYVTYQRSQERDRHLQVTSVLSKKEQIILAKRLRL